MEHPWYDKLRERSRSNLKKIAAEDFVSLLRAKCKQITTEEELIRKLTRGKKLKVKLGVDPTGAELHLGHAVPLMLLSLFERAGHEVHFIIGDFTGQIGDPSGRTDKRVQLTAGDVAKNFKTYSKQIAPLLNLKRAKIHKNSAWLSKLKLADYFSLISAISFSDVMQREDFRNRLKAGQGVSLSEANYASLMAIDSWHLKTDIEVGGIDQLLNMMQAREVMSARGLETEVILSTPLIEGTAGDGRKMSKSFNNYIALAASPEDQFGLVMTIPDKLVQSYFVSFGDIFDSELEMLRMYIEEQPLEAKKELGMLIVSLIHGEKAAFKARESFERKFGQKIITADDEREVLAALPLTVVDAIFEAMKGEYSKSRIRGLIEQGGIRKIYRDSQHIIANLTEVIEDGDLVRVGKLHYLRFRRK